MDAVFGILDGMSTLFVKIMNMSITASYVILAVLLVRLCIRLLFPEVPKKYSYLLWIVVAFRLICPWSFDSQWSLFQWELFDMTQVQQVGSGELEYIPSDITTSKDAQISLGIVGIGEVMQEEDNTLGSMSSGSSQPLSNVAVGPELGRRVLLWIGTVAWSVGVIALIGYGVISYLRLHRRMETAILLRDNVFQSERVRSPFILGFAQPRIYIPFHLKEEDLHYVLAHEQTHLKRRDHLVKPFACLLLAVHWFNPLVWLAFAGMSRDMELSCDEVVLSQGENIRKAYSETLLYLSVHHRPFAYSPLAFGETGVKTRIKNALAWKNPKLATTIGAGIACILVVVLCAANPRKPTTEEGIIGKYYANPDNAIDSTVYYTRDDIGNTNMVLYITPEGKLLIERRAHQLDDGKLVDPVEWLDAGTLEEIRLNKDNFNDYFYYNGGYRSSNWIQYDANPFTSDGPSWYRKNNWKAWCTIVEDRMYYLMQQRDGEIYIAYGYYDEEGETDPFSDDSEIYYLKRMVERTPEELQRWGVTLVEDYGMENIQPWDPVAERQQADNNEGQENQGGQVDQSQQESTSASGSNPYETLTMDAVRALAAKHETLTLQDFAPYMKIPQLAPQNDSLYEELTFEDNGVKYVLRIIASSGTNGDGTDPVLDAVVLFPEEYLSAWSAEDQKRLHSGDIRSSNITHIIMSEVAMEDYFTVVLPEGTMQDHFQAGEYMGTRLLQVIDSKVVSVGSLRIETRYHRLPGDIGEEYSSLTLDEAMMQRELVEFEDGSKMYIATITKENSNVVYRLYFGEEYFTEDEFLTTTESAVMMPHAFY